MHHAVVRQDIWLIKTLLQRGADINLKYSSAGITVLHTAAEEGFIEVVRLLLKQEPKPSIDQQDEVGRTALHRAIRAEKELVGTGIWNCIVELVNQNASVNLRDKDG